MSQHSSWETPPGQGELSEDGERYRLKWWPDRFVTKKALFRVVTDDGRALLQRVTKIRTRQRGDTYAESDDDPALDQIPRPLLAMMESEGYTPCEEVAR